MKVKDIHRDSRDWASVCSQPEASTGETSEFIHDRLTSKLRTEVPFEIS
jgi:hypothetical protein